MSATNNNQLVFINSSQSNTESSNIDTFYLANPLFAQRGNRIYCELMEAEIPVSWYTVSAENDALVLTVNSAQHSIQLTHQNYNINQLISEINAKFSGNSSFSLLASFNSQTNKIKLSLSSSSNFTSLSIHESTTCLKICGFVKSQAGSLNNQSAEITSQNVINLNRTMNVYVKTNLKTRNINAKGELDSTIAKIGVNKQPGEVIHYDNFQGVKFMLANRFLDHLEITLEDDEHKKLNLNGLEYHITFAFVYGKEELQPYIDTFSDKVRQLAENRPDSDSE